MKIVIVGAGALGCALHAYTGFPVYSRRPPFSFRVTTPVGVFESTTISDLPTEDSVIINTHKLQDITSFNPMTIYTQNGLLPFSVDYRFLVYFGSRQVSKNVFSTEGIPRVVAVVKNRQILDYMPSIKFELAEDQKKAEWRKLAAFLPIALVASLHNDSNDIVERNPSAKEKAISIYKEICRLGSLPFEPDTFLSETRNYGKNINSLLQDLRANRATELDAILKPINSPYILSIVEELKTKWRG